MPVNGTATDMPVKNSTTLCPLVNMYIIYDVSEYVLSCSFLLYY